MISDVVSLSEEFSQFDELTTSAPRGDRLSPAGVLPKLDSWFRVGNGLTATTWQGRSAFLLERLSDSLLSDLDRVLFDEEHKTGFAIFQGVFWHKVRKLQDEGITVGFLVFDPSYKVSGVFYPEQKAIFFDAFANGGTLEHEYRHYLQDRESQRHERAPSSLTAACLLRASRYFGELDATLVELPTWRGVFKNIEINPDWHRSAESRAIDPFALSVHWLLQADLDYPGMAADWIKGAGCPLDLITAARSISIETDEFSRRLSGHLVLDLIGLRFEDLHYWQNQNDVCVHAPSTNCDAEKQNYPDLLVRKKNYETAIDDAFTAEPQIRLAGIQKALSSLTAEEHRDLCLGAEGYGFLMDCSKEFR